MQVGNSSEQQCAPSDKDLEYRPPKRLQIKFTKKKNEKKKFKNWNQHMCHNLSQNSDVIILTVTRAVIERKIIELTSTCLYWPLFQFQDWDSSVILRYMQSMINIVHELFHSYNLFGPYMRNIYTIEEWHKISFGNCFAHKYLNKMQFLGDKN